MQYEADVQRVDDLGLLVGNVESGQKSGRSKHWRVRTCGDICKIIALRSGDCGKKLLYCRIPYVPYVQQYNRERPGRTTSSTPW